MVEPYAELLLPQLFRFQAPPGVGMLYLHPARRVGNSTRTRPMDVGDWDWLCGLNCGCCGHVVGGCNGYGVGYGCGGYSGGYGYGGHVVGGAAAVVVTEAAGAVLSATTGLWVAMVASVTLSAAAAVPATQVGLLPGP